jgi:hypothetical protein
MTSRGLAGAAARPPATPALPRGREHHRLRGQSVWAFVVPSRPALTTLSWTPVTTCLMNSQEGCDHDPCAEDSIEDAYG